MKNLFLTISLAAVAAVSVSALQNTWTGRNDTVLRGAIAQATLSIVLTDALAGAIDRRIGVIPDEAPVDLVARRVAWVTRTLENDLQNELTAQRLELLIAEDESLADLTPAQCKAIDSVLATAGKKPLKRCR